MKRTCSGCRALDLKRCALGYKTETTHHGVYFIPRTKPLEECPKPMTYDKYMDCLNEKWGK